MKRLATSASILCLIASAMTCAWQFRVDHLLPFVAGFLFILPIWKLRPSWKWSALLIPGFGYLALLLDATAFRHRMAVECRVWMPFFNTSSIVDILHSKSGRTTMYVVGDQWLDSSFAVYISSNTLFPHREHIDTDLMDPNYARDIQAVWKGPVFIAGDSLPSWAYDERNAKLHHRYHYPSKSREEFAAFVETLARPSSN